MEMINLYDIATNEHASEQTLQTIKRTVANIFEKQKISADEIRTILWELLREIYQAEFELHSESLAWTMTEVKIELETLFQDTIGDVKLEFEMGDNKTEEEEEAVVKQ